MKLIPCNINKIKQTKRYTSEVHEKLEEFIQSKYDCVEIEGYPYKNATNCRTAFQRKIKQIGYENVVCVTSGGKVFLVKTKHT